MGKTLSTTFWRRTPERGCCFSTLDFRLLDLAKLKEQSLNVHESKGLFWKSWEQSLNFTEKKGVRRSRLEFFENTAC
jgi:hypothetical protein